MGVRATDATKYCSPFHSWAVGIRPPRHAGACHPSAEGNLDRNRMRVSSHILPLDEELCSATVLGAAPSVVKGDLGRGGKVPSSPPLEGCPNGAGWLESTGLST